MIIEFGSWKVALGMEWVMPTSKAEIRAEKKARAKQNFVFSEASGQYWLGFHSAVTGKVYSAAFLVALVKPNAVVYCPVDDAHGWVCAITEGMPVVGYDKILPLSEARSTAIEWSNLFNHAEVVGELSGSQCSVPEVFESLSQELASKTINKGQLAMAMLSGGSISVKRIGVFAGAVFLIGVAAFGVKVFRETQAKREHEQITLQEAAQQLLAEKMNREKVDAERKALAAAYAAKVAAERTGMRVRVSPWSLWSGVTGVRRSLPVSLYGYKPQTFDCTTDSCRVEWVGSGRFTSPVDKLRLPNVERSMTAELKANSTFGVSSVKDSMPGSRAGNAEELAFVLQSSFAMKGANFQLQPPQPVVVDVPKGMNGAPEIIGHVGKWHASFQGATALLQATEFMQQAARWPIRVSSVKYQSLASIVDVDGEYVFVVN